MRQYETYGVELRGVYCYLRRYRRTDSGCTYCTHPAQGGAHVFVVCNLSGWMDVSHHGMMDGPFAPYYDWWTFRTILWWMDVSHHAVMGGRCFAPCYDGWTFRTMWWWVDVSHHGMMGGPFAPWYNGGRVAPWYNGGRVASWYGRWTFRTMLCWVDDSHHGMDRVCVVRDDEAEVLAFTDNMFTPIFYV